MKDPSNSTRKDSRKWAFFGLRKHGLVTTRVSLLMFFLGMERRMKAHPKLWQEFEKNIAEWLEKGYASLLDFDKRASGFFIPTFMVVREDKASTKYRLIVNGKIRVSKEMH